MSLILVAGLTSAMRFIFAGCCALAASGHVAAVPPKSVMNSRRCMHPPEGKLIDASSLTRYDGAAVRKGSQSTLDAATQCPVGDKMRRTKSEHMFSALPSNSDIARRIRHVSKVPILLQKS